MLPIVEEANYRVLEQREEIQRIRSEFQERGKLSRRDGARVDAFLEEYRFDPVGKVEEQTFDYLLARVDKVPPIFGPFASGFGKRLNVPRGSRGRQQPFWHVVL